jgi:hypothetical protein
VEFSDINVERCVGAAVMCINEWRSGVMWSAVEWREVQWREYWY